MISLPRSLDANAFASLPSDVLACVVSCYRAKRALGLSHAYARAIALLYLA